MTDHETPERSPDENSAAYWRRRAIAAQEQVAAEAKRAAEWAGLTAYWIKRADEQREQLDQLRDVAVDVARALKDDSDGAQLANGNIRDAFVQLAADNETLAVSLNAAQDQLAELQAEREGLLAGHAALHERVRELEAQAEKLNRALTLSCGVDLMAERERKRAALQAD